MTNNKELPLRLGVGIMLLNAENEIFVGKRIDNPGKHWQMPQGGIDQNENFLVAAKRELEEETNIKSIKLIKEINDWLTYELPENLLGKIWDGKYRGQKQKWFIMKFIGDDSEINIKTKHPEFLDWKWIDPENLTDIAVHFKLEIYKKLKSEIKKILD